MKAYTVKWGEEEEVNVFAETEQDAWAAYCEQNDLARKHPNLNERTITEVVSSSSSASSGTEAADATVVSPVINDTADVAINNISRMRSPERLQEVIDHDPRVTVVNAARKRLVEISESR